MDMLTAISPTILHQFDQAIHHEWLETNGLGGYASSTVIGAHTRRYHGLLVAAVNPPVGRAVMVSRLDETIHIQDRIHELSTNKYCGAIHPNGYIYLHSFERGLFPTFTYKVEDVMIRKTVAGIHGENTVVIIYEIQEGNLPVRLSLKPLYNPRNYHALAKRSAPINTDYSFEGDTFYALPQPSLGPIFIKVPNASFSEDPNWYYNFEFTVEQERGMEAVEDLFTPGQFEVNLQKGQKLGIILSTEPATGRDAVELYEAEKVRRLALIQKGPGQSPLIDRLTLAADQFIVKRNENQKTIIAGYHWFTDWGRDTMIALPGLCLANGRHDDAKKILQAFGAHTSQGMIPNRFPDYQEDPEYNNIDATLWFFVAIYKYYQATQNLAFIQEEMLPILGSILEWHERGTRYNIRMDNDGLLSGGEEGTQLTWMDAKVDDWIVTPRRGKAVEVNALWYNAWKIYAHFLHEVGAGGKANQAENQAHTIHEAFQEQFWSPELGYLYDVIHEGKKDDALRPNQLFAVSLPFPLLTHNQAQQMLEQVSHHLFTPVGMRSLAAHDPLYEPIYTGDQYNRDKAYHQGTVWSWLIGPYMDVLIRVKNEWGKEQVRVILQQFEAHLDQAGIGTVSEIFDAKSPNIPRGCIAQAWGVSEILRIIHEYDLFPAHKNRSPLLGNLIPQIYQKMISKPSVKKQVAE